MIKKILFIFLLAVFIWVPSKGLAATYYVDASGGSDSNNGLSTGAAWQTINKINTSSFQAGDNVLLKRGSTWREQLTVPSSGSAGNPITFGAYGSGGNPLINGSNLITNWSAMTQSWSTSYSTTFSTTAFNATLDRNRRVIIPAGAASLDGTSVRISFKGIAEGPLEIDGASIGLRSGSTVNFSGSPTRITFNGGSSAGTVAAGGTLVSDPININFASTSDYLIHVWFQGGYYYALSLTGGAGTYNNNTSPGVDDTLTGSPSGYSIAAGNSALVSKIEVGTDAPENVWQAALTTDPGAVWLDGVKGTKQDSVDDLTEEGDWYWASNILYLYATADPDTAYTDPGVEASIRIYGIFSNDKDYITIENIDATKSGSTSGSENIYFLNGSYGRVSGVTSTYAGGSPGGSTGSGVKFLNNPNSTVEDCLTHHNNGSGVFLRFSSDSLVSNCESHDNRIKGVDLEGDTGNTIDDVVIEHLTAYNNAEGIDLDYAVNTIIRYVTIYGSAGVLGNGSGDGINNDAGSTGSLIHHALIYNNQANGVEATAATTNSAGKIYNSTFYHNGTNSSAGQNNIYIKSSNWIVKNNISLNPVKYHLSLPSGSVNTPFTSDNNIFYPTTSGDNGGFSWQGSLYNFANWQIQSGQDSSSLAIDPLVVDVNDLNFRLTVNSPAINAGTEVGLSSDFLGKSLIGVPDIGAFEYQTASTDDEEEESIGSNGGGGGGGGHSQTTASTSDSIPALKAQVLELQKILLALLQGLLQRLLLQSTY